MLKNPPLKGVKEDETVEDDLRVGESNIFESTYGRRGKIALGERQQAISMRINDFSWSVFSRMFGAKSEVNLLVSPLSLTQNIMMLGNGLKGEAQEKVKSALGVSDFEMKEINSYVYQVNNGLDNVDRCAKFRRDNALWHTNRMNVQQEFKENTSRSYKADIFPAMMNEQTKDSINWWAREKTYGRIEWMTDNLNGEDAVMTNTNYFSGLWRDELSEKNIFLGEFRNESGVLEQVNMVSYHRVSLYVEGQTYQATRRSFGNAAFFMDFILPKEGVAPQEALAEFVGENEYSKKLMIVNLDFPLFTSASRVDLVQQLQDMGINGIFGENNTNSVCLFSEPIFVNSIIQKNYLSLDEKGTESATGLYAAKFDTAEEVKEEVDMTLNRPFFYAISELSTMTPLFIGYQGSVK